MIKNFLNNYLTIVIVLLIFLSYLFFLLNSGYKLNDKKFSYPIDDVYIHMAIAKNFALDGVWGVDKYEFSSATSAPLWTLLISIIYFLFGTNEFTPLILNILLGIILIFTIYFILKKFLSSNIASMITLLIIFIAPLFTLIIGGMEHVLHSLVSLIFIFLSTKILTEKKYSRTKNIALLWMAPLLTITRYESIFLVAVVCLLLVLRRRFFYSFALLCTSFFSIGLYGFISIIKGWYFLPNSVLLKGVVPDFSFFGMIAFIKRGHLILSANPHIFILLSSAIILLIINLNKYKNIWNIQTLMLMELVMITISHILFASMGWYYRYETYLIVIGITAISVGLSEYIPNKLRFSFNIISISKCLSIIFLLNIILFPYYTRAREAFWITPLAMKNVSDQQYQMGLFLNEFYKNKGIAANDIGAISFLADIKLLDLWGLSSIEIANAKINKTYSTQQIDLLTNQKDISIAVVYEEFYKQIGGLPNSWSKVGEWTISNNVICASPTISFYSVKPSETNDLILNLKSFSTHLPVDVIQTGKYTL